MAAPIIVGSAKQEAADSSVTVPAHLAGDTLILFTRNAGSGGGALPPALPGWVDIINSGANPDYQPGWRIAKMVDVSNSITSISYSAFARAVHIFVTVIRGEVVASASEPLTLTGYGGPDLTIPGLPSIGANSIILSWVMANQDLTLVDPVGLTRQYDDVSPNLGGGSAACWSSVPVSTWTGASVPWSYPGGTYWQSAAVEIKSAPVVIPLPEVTMPAGILPFAAADHVITPEPLYVQVDRQAGHTRSRRRFRSVPTMVSTSFEVTQAQLEAFYDWHENALIAGSLPFSARIAKIGPGLEWWRAYIVKYTVDHDAGSHRTVKVQLKLVGEPSDTGPISATMTAEFLADLVSSADPNFGSAMTIEFISTLETDVDMGPLLFAQFFGRLYTQVGDGPANVSMDAEFLTALQTVVIIEPGAALAAEFLAGLITTTYPDMDLSAEVSAALVATSSTGASSIPSPGNVVETVVAGDAPRGRFVEGVQVGSNGEILLRTDNLGFRYHANWWSPTQTGVGAGRWVRATHLSGDNFGSAYSTFSQPTGVWLDLSTSRAWYYVDDAITAYTLSARIDIAADPDGYTILSSFFVTYTLT